MTTAAFPLFPHLSWRSWLHGLRSLLVSLCVLSMAGCGSTQELVNQQQKALVSLRSTVIAVGDAWLERNVSTTYARTALEATTALLEKERTRVAASADALVDPRVASISESQNQLARQIATLRKALTDSDAAAVRQQLAAVSSRQSQQP